MREGRAFLPSFFFVPGKETWKAEEESVMRDFEAWLRQYRAAVEEVFGERIVCIGLQGSRGRGEAGTGSDIDMVLVLDDVSAEDLLS